MDPNYDDYLDFHQDLDQEDQEYNEYLDKMEEYSQEQELPEDF